MIDMQDMLSKIKNKLNNDYLDKLAKSSYSEDRNYPENFSNWYPLIKDTGYFKTANIINNQIFTFEEVQIMQETDNIDKVNWDKINKILKPTLDKLENNKLYSIKNGCFSNKFNFSTCVTNKSDLAINLWKLNYMSCMYETGGFTELVVRELIPYNRATTPTIYNGMPLRTEVRVFYNMNTQKIEYINDYWDYEYCFDNLDNLTDKLIFEWFSFNDNKDKELIYTVDYIYQYIHTLKFDKKLQGIWSLDFMLCKDCEEKYNGVYLIDMARGSRSAYYDRYLNSIKK